MNKMEKDQTLIVISIGETDQNYVESVVEELRGKFKKDFSSGLIEIISPTSSLYHPKLDNLRISFNDTPERVRWRSKENLDTSFLMRFAMDKSKYFLMIEDDVITKPNFISKIFELIELSNRTTVKESWLMLKLCRLGTVATLFRSSNLRDISDFLYIFYDSKPVDWLLDNFLSTKYCSMDWPHKKCHKEKEKFKLFVEPSLFQHVGVVSSLSGKLQTETDRNFK